MSLQHFLADQLQTTDQLLALIDLAIDIKSYPAKYQDSLAGKSVVMLFEKPSLRTHISFDIGIQKLGGHSLYIGQQNGQLGERERIKDVAKNLACWSDAIVARVFKQDVLDEMAVHAGIPVINALSDLYHPCQALADYVSLTETFGKLEGLNVAYVGDGNNVSNSLMLMGSILGVNVTVITPKGFEPNPDMVAKAQEIAEEHGATLTVSTNIDDIQNNQVIYTDTWVSMGDDTKVEKIEQAFGPFQVNEELMAKAGATKMMHCQPAHLGQEVNESVFDSDQNLAFSQAENRMWAQNAVLITLLT